MEAAKEETENVPKRNAFDNLDRDELIKKCKSLIMLAKNAKSTKDEYAAENAKLKQHIEHYEIQKKADKENLKTMQEIVEQETVKKLERTEYISQLEKGKENMQRQLNTLNEQIKSLSQQAIEVESLQRQNKRLTDENEDLLKTLEQLENEQNKSKANDHHNMDEINSKLIELQKQNDALVGDVTLHSDNFNELQKLCKTHEKKLKLYKTKLVDFSSQLKQLKACKEILLTTVKEYSSAVTKWQLEIVSVSQHLFEKNRNLKSENKQLRTDMEKLLKDNQNIVEKLTTDLNQQTKRCEEIQAMYAKESSSDVDDIDSNQMPKEQREDNQKYLNEIDDLKETLAKVRSCVKKHCTDNDQLKESLALAENNNDEHLNEISSLKDLLADEKSSFEKLLTEYEQLKETLTVANENQLKEIDNLKDLLAAEKSSSEKLLAEYEQSKKTLSESNTKYLKEIDNLREKLNSERSNEDNNYLTEINELKEQLSREKSIAEKHSADLLLFEEAKQNCLKEINDLKEKLHVETSNQEKYITDLVLFKETNENYLTEINKLKENLASEKSKVEKYNADLAQLEETNKNLFKEMTEMKEAMNCEKTKKSQNKSNLEKQLKEKSNKIAELEEQFSNQLINIKELESALEAKTSDLNNNEQKYSSKCKEIDELLAEMRELNEALKNRGDIISKQEQQISALTSDEQQNAKQIKEQNDSIEKLTETISELERSVAANSSISFNEQLSTSTISRAEELSRMRDVEEGFEEKYNKLRQLALKLKKKVSEQKAIIDELESSNSQTRMKDETIPSVNSSNTKLDVQKMKSLQMLQGENDKLQDKLDVYAKEKDSFEKQISQLNEKIKSLSVELEQSKQIVVDVNSSSDANNAKKSNLDHAVKEYVKQIQAQKEELATLQSGKKSVESELQQIKDELDSKKKQLAAKQEVENSLNIELNKLKSTVLKTNVMTLEIEAYEKSLKDNAQKLEARNLQVTELQATIKTNEQSIGSLKNEIKILEETLCSEKEHSNELKQQVDLQQSKLKSTEHDKSELKIKIDELAREKNETVLELTDCKLELVNIVSENEKVLTALKADAEHNLNQLDASQNEAIKLKEQLEATTQELNDVKNEFTNYKVRAQNVLRTNQTKDNSRELDLEEELSTAQTTIENLTTKVNQLLDQNKQISTNLNEIKSDRDRQQERTKELLKQLDEFRTTTETLQNESRTKHSEYQEAIKAQRLQIETLNNCYKKQIAELEASHSMALESLKLIQSKKVDENRNQSNAISSEAKPAYRQPSTDEQKIDWILMERQAGEGSENTNSNYLQRKVSSGGHHSRGKHDLIPLADLLSGSFEENSIHLMDDTMSSIDIQATKDELVVQETRVRHLTSLLSEAEQNIVRLTQLNDVLKEELRRQERSTEREQHMHNLEYIKNVIFKFLTINAGDEKSHLVPVLNTILKLSPEETHKLLNVAKGGDANGGPKSGWGRYLPI